MKSLRSRLAFYKIIIGGMDENGSATWKIWKFKGVSEISGQCGRGFFKRRGFYIFIKGSTWCAGGQGHCGDGSILFFPGKGVEWSKEILCRKWHSAYCLWIRRAGYRWFQTESEESMLSLQTWVVWEGLEYCQREWAECGGRRFQYGW